MWTCNRALIQHLSKHTKTKECFLHMYKMRVWELFIIKGKNEHLHHGENKEGRDSLEMGWWFIFWFGEVESKPQRKKPCYFPQKIRANNGFMMLPYAAALHIKKTPKCTSTWWAWHMEIEHQSFINKRSRSWRFFKANIPANLTSTNLVLFLKF